jgi:hypothetical protein
VTLKTFTISAAMRGRSLVDDNDFTPDELVEILETAVKLKRMHRRGEAHSYLAGKTLGMIFQHPSTRTRVSFEAGMTQLGGHALYLGMQDLQLRRGETVSDTAKVISRYCDCILARVVSHDDIVELGANATVPVINGLSDKFHPTQAMADMLTLQERFGQLKGLRLAPPRSSRRNRRSCDPDRRPGTAGVATEAQATRFVVGLLAEAYGLTGIRPARYALRPASTACAMASAIRAGSSASAIAVLMRTASAPASIAIAASLGVPIPASTTTGTVACSMMILIASRFRIPCPEPIGEPSGMTVAVPISCNRLARIGSAPI